MIDSGVCEKNAHLVNGHGVECTPPRVPRSSMLCMCVVSTARRWAFFSHRSNAPLQTRSTLKLGRGVVIPSLRPSTDGRFFRTHRLPLTGTSVDIFTHTYMHTCITTHISVHTPTIIHKHTYTHKHTSTHTHIRTYIHTYIHPRRHTAMGMQGR